MFTNLNNLEIDAPHFPGFYCSVFDCELDGWEYDFDEVFKGRVDDGTYKALKQEMESDVWLYFRNTDYQDKIGENFTYTLEEMLNNIEGMPKLELKFVRIDSPKYYNYSTDQCVVKVDGLNNNTLKELVKLAQKWEKELRAKIEEDWSTRDGFWSFIDNDYDHWIKVLQLDEYALKEYADVTDTDSGKLHSMIGILLGYLVELENPSYCEELIEGSLEDVCECTFIDYDKLLAKFNLTWEDVDALPKQLDLVDWLNAQEK